jgi:hypothetical protein
MLPPVWLFLERDPLEGSGEEASARSSGEVLCSVEGVRRRVDLVVEPEGASMLLLVSDVEGEASKSDPP